MPLHSKYSIIIAKNKGQDAIARTLPQTINKPWVVLEGSQALQL